MDRKKYLVILKSVTAVCILAGLYIHVFRYAVPLFRFGTGQESKIVSDTVTFDRIDSIDLDLDVFNVEIKQGDDYSLSYECAEHLRPEFRIDEGKLVISDRKVKNRFFQVGTGLFGKESRMTITLPEDSSLISLSSETDVGNIRVGDISVGEAKFEADTGNISTDGVRATVLTLEADAGNVSVSDSEAKELNIKTDAGNISVDSTSAHQAGVSSDVGNITINGEFGALTGETNVGSIDYNCPSDPAENRVSLTTDVGTIKVNGVDQGSRYSK